MTILEKRAHYARQWRARNLEKCRRASRERASQKRKDPTYREKMAAYLKEYRRTHIPVVDPIKRRAQAARWKAKNPDYFRMYSKKQYWKDPRRSRLTAKRTRVKRRADPIRLQRHRSWVAGNVKKKKRQNIQFRIASLVRRRMLLALKNPRYKSAPSEKLLGCSFANYKCYLESLWLPGMTWDNHGKGNGHWHVDHIRPCAAFDLTQPEQQRQCFHFSNTRPLWEEDNLTKGSTVCVAV